MNQDNAYFADRDSLPIWFKYPKGFRDLVEQDTVLFGQWRLINAQSALKIYVFLRQRYGRELFPVALREGSDDMACVEKDRGEVVVNINSYTSPGRETMAEFASFWAWFRAAIEDMIDFYS